MMGILNQPTYKTYWSKDAFLGNKAIQKVFCIRRYQKISEYLHISNREEENHADRLAKIRPLYDHLKESFPRFMHPGKCQTIDEGIIAFKGIFISIQIFLALT